MWTYLVTAVAAGLPTAVVLCWRHRREMSRMRLAVVTARAAASAAHERSMQAREQIKQLSQALSLANDAYTDLKTLISRTFDAGPVRAAGESTPFVGGEQQNPPNAHPPVPGFPDTLPVELAATSDEARKTLFQDTLPMEDPKASAAITQQADRATGRMKR